MGCGGGERGGNGGGQLFFQSTPAENLPLPHSAPSTPPAKRSSGEAAWQAQFLRGGIKLAHWLSQLPHNWPRSFLIPPGSVKDASQRVALCFLGCWLPFWWSPRGFNLLAIHPHQNLQAHHSPTLARLSSQAHTARLQKQLTQRWVFFIPHLPGICWNSSLQKDTAAVNGPQPPTTSTSSPPSSATGLILSGKGGREPEKAGQSSCSPLPPQPAAKF